MQDRVAGRDGNFNWPISCQSLSGLQLEAGMQWERWMVGTSSSPWRCSRANTQEKSQARLYCPQAGTQQLTVSAEGNKAPAQLSLAQAPYMQLMQILLCCSLFPTSLVIITCQEQPRAMGTAHRPSTAHPNFFTSPLCCFCLVYPSQKHLVQIPIMLGRWLKHLFAPGYRSALQAILGLSGKCCLPLWFLGAAQLNQLFVARLEVSAPLSCAITANRGMGLHSEITRV